MARRSIGILVLLLGAGVAIWMLSERSSSRLAGPTAGEASPELPLADAPTADSLESPKPPAWSIPYGDEFWRAKTAEPAPVTVDGADGRTQEVDLSQVMERTGNAFRIREGDTVPTARTFTHRTALTSQGVRFFPYQPAREQAENPGEDIEADHELAQSLGDTPTYDPELFLDWDLESVTVAGKPATSVGEWHHFGNTAQRRLKVGATEVVEHVESRDAGLERTWVLPRHPADPGDVVIETAVRGLTARGSTEQGTHYADPEGRSRARISGPVLVDAAGQRTELAVDATATGLRYTIPGRALADAEFPVALDPVLGSEFTINRPVATAAQGNQRHINMTRRYYGGSVIVWEDSRVSPTKVFAARLDEFMNVEDPVGLEIADGSRPRVHCVESRCYAVYRRRKDGYTQIFGTPFSSTSASGSVGSERQITSTSTNAYDPDVSDVSGRWVVIYSRYTGGKYNVYARAVSSSGSLWSERTIDSSSGNMRYPRISGNWNGQWGIIVWLAYRSSNDIVKTSLIDGYGNRIHSPQTVSYPTSWNATAADVSTEVHSNYSLIAWVEGHGTSRYLRCARISWSPTGSYARQHCSSPLVSSSSSSMRFEDVEVSERPWHNQSGYLVSWREYNSSSGLHYIRAAMVSAGATPGTRYTVHSTSSTTDASAHSCGDDYCHVGWHEQGSADYDLYTHRLSAYGQPYSSEKVVAVGQRTQKSPRVAMNENYGLVTWVDYRSGGAELYAAGLRVTGSPNVYGSGFLVSSGTNVYSYDVADVGSSYFPIAFGIQDSAGNRRVQTRYAYYTGGRGGTYTLDTTDTVPYYVRIVRSGSRAMVTWRDLDPVTGFYGVEARTVSVFGSPSGSVRRFPRSGHQYYPDVAGDAASNDVLVGYSERVSSGSYEVKTTRLTHSGSTPSVSTTRVVGTQTSSSVVRIAKGDNEYLVGWTTTTPSVYVQRLSVTNSKIGTSYYVSGSRSRGLEFLESDGSGYLIGYTRSSSDERLDARFLYPSGGACGGVAHVVSASANRYSVESSSASFAPGRYFVAYDRYEHNRTTESGYLVRARTLDESFGADLDKDNDGVTVCGGDQCDDTPGIFAPTSEIIADGIDQNCDGRDLCYYDYDGDTYGRNSTYTDTNMDCSDGSAPTSARAGDCNDNSNAIRPGASELIADGTDQDCDGGDLCYADHDGDGVGRGTTYPDNNLDCGDGSAPTSSVSTDCDDGNASVWPGAVEVCDSTDNDCDGDVVEEFFDNDVDGIPDCADADNDNDGVGNEADPCPFIADVTSCAGDTDGDGLADGDETLLARSDPNTGPPGVAEICDGKDNNGNGLIDEGTGCNQCD